MDFLRKFWPLSFNRKVVKDLVISVIIYVVAGAVVDSVLLFLSKFVPLLTYPIISVTGLYCTAGIAFSFLNYFKVGPFKD